MLLLTWHRIPQYAARCFREVIRGTDERVVVISVCQDDSAKNLEEVLGAPILNIAGDDPRGIAEIVGEVPRFMLAAGWAEPSLMRWAREVKAAGGKVAVEVDEPYLRFNWKTLARMIQYRLRFARLYDYVFACGAEGRKLYHLCGVPHSRIFESMCAADPGVFFNGAPLPERPKRIVYVGRYIPLKNILRVCEAFMRVAEKFPGWTLDLYGNGELANSIPKHPAIIDHGYAQNGDLGEIYRQAQISVLASWKDNWGVVVHEGALSGCMLLLSNRVGAAADFAASENAVVFDPYSVDEIAAGMEKLMVKSDAEKLRAQEMSLERGSHFSPAVFAKNVFKMVGDETCQ